MTTKDLLIEVEVSNASALKLEGPSGNRYVYNGYTVGVMLYTQPSSAVEDKKAHVKFNTVYHTDESRSALSFVLVSLQQYGLALCPPDSLHKDTNPKTAAFVMVSLHEAMQIITMLIGNADTLIPDVKVVDALSGTLTGVKKHAALLEEEGVKLNKELHIVKDELLLAGKNLETCQKEVSHVCTLYNALTADHAKLQDAHTLVEAELVKAKVDSRKLNDLREELTLARKDLFTRTHTLNSLRDDHIALEEMYASLQREHKDLQEQYHTLSDELEECELSHVERQQAQVKVAASRGNCPPHYDLSALGEGLEVHDVLAFISSTIPVNNDYLAVSMYLEVIRYVLRAPRKNGLEDLEKARHYLSLLLSRTRDEGLEFLK